LKTSTPVTLALGNVRTNCGFSIHLLLFVRDRRTDGQTDRRRWTGKTRIATYHRTASQ